MLSQIVNKKCGIFLVFLMFGLPATCLVKSYSTDYSIFRSEPGLTWLVVKNIFLLNQCQEVLQSSSFIINKTSSLPSQRLAGLVYPQLQHKEPQYFADCLLQILLHWTPLCCHQDCSVCQNYHQLQKSYKKKLLHYAQNL